MVQTSYCNYSASLHSVREIYVMEFVSYRYMLTKQRRHNTNLLIIYTLKALFRKRINNRKSNMAPYTSISALKGSSSIGASSHNDKPPCASRQSPDPTRSTTFSPYSTMHNVLHINDYSDKEIACTRYDANELEMIKKTDVIKTLSMMNKSGLQIPQDNPWYCCHGLESFTREGSARKRANRTNAWDAVLDEQDLQWDEGVCDPQAIANAYSGLSRDCQDAAVMNAIQDHDMSSDTSVELKKRGGASFAFRSTTIAPGLLSDDCCRREISSKAA